MPRRATAAGVKTMLRIVTRGGACTTGGALCGHGRKAITPPLHRMIQPTLIAAILLLSVPAQAGSFYPSLFGARYCELRAMGVENQEAIKVSILQNWSKTRQTPSVTIDGKEYSLDVIEGSNYIKKNCPEFAQ